MLIHENGQRVSVSAHLQVMWKFQLKTRESFQVESDEHLLKREEKIQFKVPAIHCHELQTLYN